MTKLNKSPNDQSNEQKTTSNNDSVKRIHSISSSIKSLFGKTHKPTPEYEVVPRSELSNKLSTPLSTPAVSPTSPINSSNSSAKSPTLVATNKKQILPTIYTSEETNTGFAPLIHEPVTHPATPHGSKSNSRRNSHDHIPTLLKITKPIAAQENHLILYKNGSHEHQLPNVKALEKATSSGGLLSGFLRKSTSCETQDNAFSLLPEQNRLDFQKRLSIQSRKTTDSNSIDDDSYEYSDASDDDFDEIACIGDSQLTLINKLRDKIKANEDPSLWSGNYKLTEKYGKPVGIIGKGTYGLVKLVSKVDQGSKTEILYAVKELKKRDNEDIDHFSNRLTSEFVISNSLKHINIVRMIDLMKTSTGTYSEVMEYCSAGDLYSLISKTKREGLNYIESDCFFKQIVHGVQFMHTRGVSHCDLKPENILLTSNGIAKISDFGTAAVFRASWEKTVHFSNGACGSEPYVAPEEFNKADYDPRSADIWALGILYFTMATGSYPWVIAKEEEDDIFAKYLEERPRKNKAGSFEVIDSIKGGSSFRSRVSTIYAMLDPNASTRITAGDILKTHWIRDTHLCEAVSGYYK
ncbi:hypothetical protein WICMUC_004916 [Wickerhamomyces mucosus]|uniref:Protein kinase domain-containing protein n=1 Tax=Wickerhamomyces mucosus TaxID=1378264 RepID=A0A9P8T8H6_9ASCO|nr:hypothetical protein WICMUC_004916 [Wickerhamomyces mucosus]